MGRHLRPADGVTGGTVTSADDVVSGGKNMINSLIQNEDKLYFKVVMTHDVSSLCARNIISKIQKICFYMFHTSAFAWYQNCSSKNKFLWFT